MQVQPQTESTKNPMMTMPYASPMPYAPQMPRPQEASTAPTTTQANSKIQLLTLILLIGTCVFAFIAMIIAFVIAGGMKSATVNIDISSLLGSIPAALANTMLVNPANAFSTLRELASYIERLDHTDPKYGQAFTTMKDSFRSLTAFIGIFTPFTPVTGGTIPSSSILNVDNLINFALQQFDKPTLKTAVERGVILCDKLLALNWQISFTTVAGQPVTQDYSTMVKPVLEDAANVLRRIQAVLV